MATVNHNKKKPRRADFDTLTCAAYAVGPPTEGPKNQLTRGESDRNEEFPGSMASELQPDKETLRSPLWMVMQEPSVTRLVDHLQRTSRKILAQPERVHTIRLSRREMERTREDFYRSIRRGQAKLHQLCALLCNFLLHSPYELKSVVIGEIEASHERFTLMQTLQPKELYELTDRELGKQQLRRLRFQMDDPKEFSRAQLVANFVEYQPEQTNPFRIHKLISRIKAEQEIWNKVVDEIFALDTLVQQDKQLRQMSRYVKDIFGLKIVVSDDEAAHLLHNTLTVFRWPEGDLQPLKIPHGPNTRSLDFLEVKDYLGKRGPKESGWQAIKSVVRWWDATFEIQVQPLHNYYRELERLSQESHAGFKARREALREQVAQSIPLFKFYRDLLRWLFRSPHQPAPTFPSVSLEVTD